MLALTNRLVFETTRAPEFIDITDGVVQFVSESHVQNGCVVIYSRHTTAAIKVNENEPLLLKDMERFLERMAPSDAEYGHDDFSIRTVNLEEDDHPNGHSHCQHLLLGTSETVPVIDGELQLGKWQRVFLVELDRPRTREVVLQALGE